MAGDAELCFFGYRSIIEGGRLKRKRVRKNIERDRNEIRLRVHKYDRERERIIIKG
jgi:hypothetical protein